MGLAYVIPVNAAENLYNIITLSPGSPPPRPHPEPPLGIWGPTDPRPSLPIAGWNPDGSWGPPGGGGGGGGGGGPVAPGPGTPVTITPLPPGMEPPPTPEGLPEGSVPVLIFYQGERYPAVAWVQPSPSSGPVNPEINPLK